MQIQNAIITGSFSYNGADLSNVTSSNAYSASLSSRTTNLESTSSVLVGASSSFSSILTSVSSSQQQLSASFLTLTASFNAVSASQQQISASYIALSASYNTFSGSASTRITANSSSIQQVSSSQQQISSSYIALSGSYNVFSGSASTRVTQIETVYATTGSNSFRATQSITGSLVVTGQIVAQSINVQQVTSSIIYSSGSNVFGCDINSRQTFTGSLYQTGSLASFSGQLCVGSSLVLGTNNAYALYLRDSAGNPKPIIASAGSTNLNFYNICSTGKVNINNAADNAVLMSIDNTGAATFSGQLCSITGVFGTKGGGNYGVLISDNDQSNVRLKFTNTGTGGTSMSIVGGNPGLSNSGLAIYDETNAATRLYVSANGNVGIGTYSPNIGGYGANGRILTIQGVSGSYGVLELTSNSANADGSAIGRLDFGSDGQAANYKAISSISSFLAGSTSTKFGADLRFYTRVDNAVSGDPVERMRITSAGNVGIGTCVPSAKLTILRSGSSLTTLGQSRFLDITDDYGAANSRTEIGFGYTSQGTATNIPFVIGYLQTSTSAYTKGDLYFATRDVTTDSALTERMRITSCGKVGIIATDPKWLLEICCNTTATGGGGYPAISINNPNDAGYSALYFFKGSTNMGGLELSNATCHLFINTNCTFAIQTNNTERLRVTNAGAVCLSSSIRATMYCMAPDGTNQIYSIVDSDATYTGQWAWQAGRGSAGYGGTVLVYGHSHATRPGFVSAGISSGSGGKFTVMSGGNGSGSDMFTINASGAGTLVGALTQNTSDNRLKNNVKNIDNAIAKVMSLNGVTFDWNDIAVEYGWLPRIKNNDIGVLAQEVQSVLPQAIDFAPFDRDESNQSKSGQNYLTVQYEKIVPLLIEGIKEQQCMINQLKTCLGIN